MVMIDTLLEYTHRNIENVDYRAVALDFMNDGFDGLLGCKGAGGWRMGV